MALGQLRMTNIVRSPFASVRLRTDASRRYKRVEGAKGIIWKMLGVAEKEVECAGAAATGGLRHDVQERDQAVKSGQERNDMIQQLERKGTARTHFTHL